MSATLLTLRRCKTVERLIESLNGKIYGYANDEVRVLLPRSDFGRLVNAMQLCKFRFMSWYKTPAYVRCPAHLLHDDGKNNLIAIFTD
jgi:hypothetical protein